MTIPVVVIAQNRHQFVEFQNGLVGPTVTHKQGVYSSIGEDVFYRFIHPDDDVLGISFAAMIKLPGWNEAWVYHLDKYDALWTRVR